MDDDDDFRGGKHWHGSEEEYTYLHEDRKESKRERKIASRTDRSKFKKTDQKKKAEIAPNNEGLLRGRVLSISPQGIVVDQEGKDYVCQLKGTLKQERERLKNLVTVGDFVWFEPLADAEGAISRVEERASVLSRADHLRRRSEQLIAANIDQVLITVSIAKPSLKHALVDRYLIAAEKGAMVPVIIVNKTDLLQTPEGSEERQFFEQFYHDYTSLGFQVIPVSVVTGEGLQELEAVMEGKASVFSGQSGVGKSSLINAIMGKDLPIGDIVLRTQKGSHTTTMTQLIPIARGGFCIDTPGIRSFGLWRLGVGETVGYFNEILIKGRDCKYAGCRHLEEPGCVVRESVEAGEISALRYDSYVKLVEEEESEWTK